jgi:hypothetical protein
MNQGKRYLRNTVFVLWGTAAVFVGWNRVYSAVSTGAPQGKYSMLTLGLRQDTRDREAPGIDLAQAKDFTRLSVRGRINVEIVGASAFKVSFTPAAGKTPRIKVFQSEGTLHVSSREEEGDQGELSGDLEGALRVEVPTLSRIDVAANQIVVRGLHAQELSVFGFGTGESGLTVRLQDNQVAQWKLFSGSPMEVRVDDATFAAGTLKSNGDVVIRRDE